MSTAVRTHIEKTNLLPSESEHGSPGETPAPDATVRKNADAGVCGSVVSDASVPADASANAGADAGAGHVKQFFLPEQH